MSPAGQNRTLAQHVSIATMEQPVSIATIEQPVSIATIMQSDGLFVHYILHSSLLTVVHYVCLYCTF